MRRQHRPPDLRVQRFLRKMCKEPCWDFSGLADERQPGKIQHALPSVVWTLLLGLMGNKESLRDVEGLSQDLADWGRALTKRPISDTTLHTEAQRLDKVGLLGKLVQQVRTMQRQKRLAPAGLPIGVATVDGKNLAVLNHHASGTGHKRSQATDKWAPTQDKDVPGCPYWLMPALRVTLTSAEAKPCIYQHALAAGQGEDTAAPDVVLGLHQAYGRSALFELLDFDAGFTSLSLANCVDAAGYAYLFGLKGNQGWLFAEAHKQFQRLTATVAAEAVTDWEVRNGKRIRRKLWRTNKLLGAQTTAGTWTHLRQAWLVRQETAAVDGAIEIEDRYFISSLLWQRVSPSQILLIVRNHWGVENDTFNSLDLQWREDHAPWCTQGNAIWVLGLLRVMAYNVVQLLRRRTLRFRHDDGKRAPVPPWRRVFAYIRQAFTLPCSDALLVPD